MTDGAEEVPWPARRPAQPALPGPVGFGGPAGAGSQGVPLLSAQAAAELTRALDGIAAAVRAGQRPQPCPGLSELVALRPVAEAVRRVQGAVSGIH